MSDFIRHHCILIITRKNIDEINWYQSKILDSVKFRLLIYYARNWISQTVVILFWVVLLRWDVFGVLDAPLCDKVCQWLAAGRWFSPGTPVSSTNKNDRHDITKIVLKGVLNTINRTESICGCSFCNYWWNRCPSLLQLTFHNEWKSYYYPST